MCVLFAFFVWFCTHKKMNIFAGMNLFFSLSHFFLFMYIYSIQLYWHPRNIYLSCPRKKMNDRKFVFKVRLPILSLFCGEKKTCSLKEYLAAVFWPISSRTLLMRKRSHNNNNNQKKQRKITRGKKEHFIERHHKVRYHSKIIKTLWNWEECEKLFDAIRNLISILPLCNGFALTSYIHHRYIEVTVTLTRATHFLFLFLSLSLSECCRWWKLKVFHC